MNGKWNVENFDKKIGTFVNDVQIKNKERPLQNGDSIYILGLKIIIVGNSIFINNPSNNVIYDAQRFKKVIQEQKVVIDGNIEDDDQDIELYTEKDYFSRAPRIKKTIETETIKIDPPPIPQDQEDMPAILMLGSSFSMGLMMLISSEEIKSEKLWLEDIPETIYLKKLKTKYYKNKNSNEMVAIIGEYDDPYNQKQGPVKINFLQDGNLIVYGNAESGKETLLSTLIYDLMTSYSSDDVWIYILDFGSEALKIFRNSPHVGDVIILLIKAVNEFSGGFYNPTQMPSLFDKLTGNIYNINLTIKEAKIENGAEIIMI